MEKVVVSEFITLDGVIEAPENWSLSYWGDDIQQFKHDELMAADALLLGGTTYASFAAVWPGRPDDGDGYTDKINSMPKYAVSSSLALDWQNTTHISDDLTGAVLRLKQDVANDILIFGSSRLSQTLLAERLVDELRLLVYPVVVGNGKRLFTSDVFDSKLELTETKRFDSGVALLRYRVKDI